ncbi:hypothetical protein D9758_015439 [Tetrapyrgos nigripes]|uniref:Uncharacterized protein n=1 Tax=Tetrapyrgos nigripes TaxID=182062 RepID=A0A8H5CKU8_9AGAR|nr:hypothetical protein D9758_015439 [Tetrapyrgos nigripes]
MAVTSLYRFEKMGVDALRTEKSRWVDRMGLGCVGDDMVTDATLSSAPHLYILFPSFHAILLQHALILILIDIPSLPQTPVSYDSSLLQGTAVNQVTPAPR